jgi:hypothetical protein
MDGEREFATMLRVKQKSGRTGVGRYFYFEPLG